MIRSNAASASASKPVEHARRDPLVAAGPQRRVRHLVLEDRFDVDPRRAVVKRIRIPQKHRPVRTRGR